MSKLIYDYEIDVDYSYSDIWSIVKEPKNYIDFINNCSDIIILDDTLKKGKIYYKANIKVSTPLKYIYFKCILKEKSENEIILYNLENDYIKDLFISFKLEKINDEKTKIYLNLELLFHSYTIQLLTNYNKFKIINDILSNFKDVLNNKIEFKENSLSIIYKEVTNG